MNLRRGMEGDGRGKRKGGNEANTVLMYEALKK